MSLVLDGATLAVALVGLTLGLVVLLLLLEDRPD